MSVLLRLAKPNSLQYYLDIFYFLGCFLTVSRDLPTVFCKLKELSDAFVKDPASVFSKGKEGGVSRGQGGNGRAACEGGGLVQAKRRDDAGTNGV